MDRTLKERRWLTITAWWCSMLMVRLRRASLAMIVAFVGFGSGGCLIPVPLAVFPAACQASGLKVEFRDSEGNRIEEDGLLIVHREYYGTALPCDRDVDCLVQIEDGCATIPDQLKLASLWWRPGFPYLLFGLPVVHPGDSLKIIPLLSGYSARHEVYGVLAEGSPEETCIALPNHNDFENGTIRLLVTERGEAEASWALEYYRFVCERLWCKHERAEPKKTHCDKFFLADADYAQVKQFLVAELERLGAEGCTSRDAGEE